MSRMIACAAALCVICAPAFATTLPGTDINASPVITASVVGMPLNAKATISFSDANGTPATAQTSNTVSISTTVMLPSQKGDKVTTFVAPPTDARTYFTATKSLFTGPSLVGQNIKLCGKVTNVNGTFYIDDGACIVSTSGNSSKLATPIRLRLDLLSTQPIAGTTITITGVVRKEADGQPSLLPFDNCAIASVQ